MSRGAKNIVKLIPALCPQICPGLLHSAGMKSPQNPSGEASSLAKARRPRKGLGKSKRSTPQVGGRHRKNPARERI